MLAGLFIASCLLFLLAYRWYGRYMDAIFRIDPNRPTPAYTEQDGVDYVPTSPLILFGHHFSSIAGAGPIVGPIIAGLAFGWLPALLWIVIGSIFVGGVHDYTSLMASVRHRGRTIGQVCRFYLSPFAYRAFLIFIWFAMVYLLIVFLDLTAASFAPVTHFAELDDASRDIMNQGGQVATASTLYVVIALALGFCLYRLKLRLGVASFVFVPLVFASLWVGHHFPLSADLMPALFGSPKYTWSALLLIYCLAASLAPVWVLLQPRDYLSSYLLFVCLLGGFVGLTLASAAGRLEMAYPAFIAYRHPQLGALFPVLFVTVACGAVSGFHSIVASGTTSKQLHSEAAARKISYGAMLTEGALAIVSLSAVMILVQGPEGMTPVAVFASGIGRFFSVFGIPEHAGMTFGLLAVSTFLLTTLDTCTRLGRFVFQEFFGLEGGFGRLISTVITLALPAVFAFVELPGPGGVVMPAWMAVWPAFGATNQLLAALALLVGFVWLRHLGRKALFVLLPMIFMAVTTLTALVKLAIRNLGQGGSVFLGGLSLLLSALAVALIVNTLTRRRAPPDRPS